MVWHHSLLLMNSFNKTEAAVFSCRLCFLRAFPFISLIKPLKLFVRTATGYICYHDIIIRVILVRADTVLDRHSSVISYKVGIFQHETQQLRHVTHFIASRFVNKKKTRFVVIET